MSEPNEHRENFVTLYETYFGDFPARGDERQLAVWWRLVDALPFSRVEELIENVKRHIGNSFGRPRLGAFKQMWDDMRGRTTNEWVEHHNKPHAERCAFCDDSGWVIVPAAELRAEDGGIIYSIGAISCGELRNYAIACLCSSGDKHRHGQPSRLQRDAHEWVKIALRETEPEEGFECGSIPEAQEWFDKQDKPTATMCSLRYELRKASREQITKEERRKMPTSPEREKRLKDARDREAVREAEEGLNSLSKRRKASQCTTKGSFTG